MKARLSWKNYEQSSEEAKAFILKEMDLENVLPNLTWKQQAETFEGAPAEVTLKFLTRLAWEAQVDIYKNRLPVKARPQAVKLLCGKAQQKLGLGIKYRCLA